MARTTKSKQALTSSGIIKALDAVYQKVTDGIPVVSPSIEEFAEDYLKKHRKAEAAAKSMIKHQIVKCTTSGFLTGFGGFLTMPVAIPANISSVIYVQMRMIACTAFFRRCDWKLVCPNREH